MSDLQQMRRRAMSVGVANMETVELLFLAKNADVPEHAADVVIWSEREAVPLIRELGERLQAAITPVTA